MYIAIKAVLRMLHNTRFTAISLLEYWGVFLLHDVLKINQPALFLLAQTLYIYYF